MLKDLYCAAMEDIAPDPSFLSAAGARFRAAQARAVAKPAAGFGRYAWLAACGTCAVLIAVAAVFYLPGGRDLTGANPLPGVASLPAGGENGPTGGVSAAASSGKNAEESLSAAASPSGKSPSAGSAPAVLAPSNKEKIVFHEVAGGSTGAKRYYAPAEYDTVELTQAQMLDYFGFDPRPARLPSGLKEWEGGSVYSQIIRKNGEIAEDTALFNYSDSRVERSVYVRASRLGVPRDCGIYVWEKDMAPSKIGGASVMLGHRKMSYGPYDDPDGYYDLYVAEFQQDGVWFQVVTERLTAAETVEAVKSLLR